jgi:hypothetical protein
MFKLISILIYLQYDFAEELIYLCKILLNIDKNNDKLSITDYRCFINNIIHFDKEKIGLKYLPEHTPLNIYSGTPFGFSTKCPKTTVTDISIKRHASLDACPILNVHRCKNEMIVEPLLTNKIKGSKSCLIS